MPPASRFEQVALLSPAPERSPTASRSAASKGEDPAVPHLKHFSDGWRVWNPMIRNYVGDATRTAFADQGQASELMRAIYAEMAAAGVGPKRVTAKVQAMRSAGPDLFGAVVVPRSVGEQVGFKFNGRTWRTRGDGWWFSGPYAINLELRPAGSHGRVMGAFVLYREGREVSRHNLLAEAQAAVPGEQVAFKANGLPLDPYHATIARAVAARKPWSCEVRDWGGPSFRVDAKPAPGNDWQISVANDPGNRGAYFGAEQELGERGVQRLIVEAVDHDLGMVAHEVARLRGDPKANPFVVADRQGRAVIPAVFDSRTEAGLARRYLETSEGEGGLRVRTSTAAENARGRKRNGAHGDADDAAPHVYPATLRGELAYSVVQKQPDGTFRARVFSPRVLAYHEDPLGVGGFVAHAGIHPTKYAALDAGVQEAHRFLREGDVGVTSAIMSQQSGALDRLKFNGAHRTPPKVTVTPEGVFVAEWRGLDRLFVVTNEPLARGRAQTSLMIDNEVVGHAGAPFNEDPEFGFMDVAEVHDGAAAELLPYLPTAAINILRARAQRAFYLEVVKRLRPRILAIPGVSEVEKKVSNRGLSYDFTIATAAGPKILKLNAAHDPLSSEPHNVVTAWLYEDGAIVEHFDLRPAEFTEAFMMRVVRSIASRIARGQLAGRKRNGAHRTPPKGSLIHAEILAGGYGDTVDPAARVLRFTAIQPPEGYGKRMHSPRYEINELVADAAGAQVARSGKKAVGVVFRGVDRTGSGAAEAAQAVAALSQRLHGDPRALRAQVSHGKRNDLGRRLPPPPPPPSFDTYAYGRPVYADEARESRPRRRSVEDYEAISMLKPNGRRPRDMATLDLFAAPAQPRLLPDAGRPRMATVEDLATAPLGSLLLTSDRHVAYRHATPGKAGWISQMPSASSPDGWKQRGGGQPPGLRLFRVLTDMMARESFYLAPPVFTAAKHNPAGQLPATVERCVAKVAPRRVDDLGAREGLSSAIAICTAQGQRQGTLRKGTRTPTTRGRAAQRSARRRKGFAEAERAVGRMAREARKENSVRNRRVNITPGAPEEHAVYGTLKTVHGMEVVEVHSRLYQSPDLRFCVRQLADEHCNSPTRGRWIVEDERDRSSSDLIATKREAFEALRETQRESASGGNKGNGRAQAESDLSPVMRAALERCAAAPVSDQWVWDIPKNTARSLEARGLVEIESHPHSGRYGRGGWETKRSSVKYLVDVGCRITAAGREALRAR